MEHCKVNTENIKAGQVFKSVQELSLETTGEPMPRGAKYKTKVKLLQRYLSWEYTSNSRRIVIKEVYPSPKPVHSKSKLSPQLLSNFTQLDLTKSYRIYDLYLALGLANERFTEKKYYLYNINTLSIPFKLYKVIHAEIDSVLRNTLSQFFSSMRSKDILSYSVTYLYKFKNESKDVPMELIKNKALENTSFDSEWSVLHSNEKDEYKELIRKELDSFGVLNYCKVYNFSIIDTPIDLPQASIQELNKYIVNKLKKHFEAPKKQPYQFYANKLIDASIFLQGA